jgi:hypothetical protein
LLGQHAIVPIDAYDRGHVGARLVGRHVGVRRENHQVAGLVEVRRGAVDANDARAARPFERVRHQPRAAGDVPNVHGFVRKDAGGLEQVGVDRDAALVMKIGVGDGRTVNLRLEHVQAHDGLKWVAA